MNQQMTLSPAQIRILDMMSFVKTPAAIDELNHALADYFAKRIDEEIDEMWDKGILSDEKVESFRQLHERTPYKEK